MKGDFTRPADATSYRETAFGIIPRAELVKLEAKGIAKGLEYVLYLKTDEPLTPGLLLHLHKICFGWIFPDWAGKYRSADVETSTYRFPPFYKVPELAKSFFDNLNERLKHSFDSVELIAWAQYQLVWIHPFLDYNGRIARLFSNLLMLRFGLPIVEVRAEKGQDRKRYIQAMKAADRGDFTKLINLIKNSLEEK